MVKKVIKKDKRYFMCEACNMFYETEELTKKFEYFCKKHKGCSLEIIKHAINID